MWGISATPERFNQAIARWTVQRTNKMIAVPLEAVRASGLLKDKIVLDNPASGQVEGDTSFIRAGVVQTLKFEEEWRRYASEQNGATGVASDGRSGSQQPSEAEMAEILGSIFGAWEGLRDQNVVNTFGEHTAISAGGRTVGYMAPQDIQDDPQVRVVLCKDAISTGWDCPRAEVRCRFGPPWSTPTSRR